VLLQDRCWNRRHRSKSLKTGSASLFWAETCDAGASTADLPKDSQPPSRPTRRHLYGIKSVRDPQELGSERYEEKLSLPCPSCNGMALAE